MVLLSLTWHLQKTQTPWPHRIPPSVFSVIATAHTLPRKLDDGVSACGTY